MDKQKILLSENKQNASQFFGKVREFSTQANKFKELFTETVTPNIEIEFTKEWLKAVCEGSFVDDLGLKFYSFLQKQKPMYRDSLDKEFTKIIEPLKRHVFNVNRSFEDLQVKNTFDPDWGAIDVCEFENLPVDDQGNVSIDESYKASTEEKFKVYVSTDIEHQKYELLEKLASLKKDFQRLYGEDAGYVWPDVVLNFKDLSLESKIRAIK